LEDAANQTSPALQALQQRGDVLTWLREADVEAFCPALHHLDRHLSALGLRLKHELAAAGVMRLSQRSDAMVGANEQPYLFIFVWESTQFRTVPYMA